MYRLGLMITSRCDFECGHCMFSCKPRAGKKMSDELIRHIGKFIRNNNITDINIYGGEPFLDVNHYEKCFQEWYEGQDMNWYVKSNGSFVGNKKRLRYVLDHLRRYATTNRSEAGFTIEISNDDWHDEFRSEELLCGIKDLANMAEYPSEYYGYDKNPFVNEYDHHVIQFGRKVDKYRMNPSGRALETCCYDHDKKCYCMMTSSSTYSTFEDMIDDHGIGVDVNGNIQMCCSCESGSAGNIMDMETVADIAEAVKYFRDKFRKKYDVSEQARMIDLCPLCKAFKIRRRKIKI